MPRSHQYTDGMEPATEGNISAFQKAYSLLQGLVECSSTIVISVLLIL